MVKDGGVQGRFSALPHDVIRDSRLSASARLLVAVLQMYGWQGAEITASHATLAADMGCGLKSLRGYLDELIGAGIVTERDAGVRRQKVYTLTFNTSKTTHCPPVNTSETTDCTGSNAQILPVQCVVLDDFNTSKTTHSKKKTPEKKTKEEDVPPSGVGVAAAPQPATTEPKASKARGTRCPETFDLTEKHLAYADTLGFSPEQARAETDKFLAHHRFKGTVGVDWYAGWQNWLRKAVTFAQQRPSTPQRNGSIPPGSASKQMSSWADRKNRHGGEVVRSER